MINVSMRKHHMIDRLRIKVRETTINLMSIPTAPLIKPTIQKNALTIDF